MTEKQIIMTYKVGDCLEWIMKPYKKQPHLARGIVDKIYKTTFGGKVAKKAYRMIITLPSEGRFYTTIAHDNKTINFCFHTICPPCTCEKHE